MLQAVRRVPDDAFIHSFIAVGPGVRQAVRGLPDHHGADDRGAAGRLCDGTARRLVRKAARALRRVRVTADLQPRLVLRELVAALHSV